MAKPGHFFDFENNFACKHLEMSIRTGNTEDALQYFAIVLQKRIKVQIELRLDNRDKSPAVLKYQPNFIKEVKKPQELLPIGYPQQNINLTYSNNQIIQPNQLIPMGYAQQNMNITYPNSQLIQPHNQQPGVVGQQQNFQHIIQQPIPQHQQQYPQQVQQYPQHLPQQVPQNTQNFQDQNIQLFNNMNISEHIQGQFGAQIQNQHIPYSNPATRLSQGSQLDMQRYQQNSENVSNQYQPHPGQRMQKSQSVAYLNSPAQQTSSNQNYLYQQQFQNTP